MLMQISDLITKDSDRVFVVDHGCFIIYTGNSLSDTQPFIRIGNWPQMPVQLIDLIENIVITDELTGNPAMEQFNIDIGILSSNRYIGSHFTVKYYLDFQKIFGLDLTNAQIVDTEKDIPEIQGRNVSERGAFIGIFYNDGNFIIKHGSREFFNLSKLSQLAWDSDRIYDQLRQQAQPNLYDGFGVVLTGTTPLFYKNNYFASYLFPEKYMHHFAINGVDPAKVTLLIHPSSNYLNAAPFLKWLKKNEGKVTIVSDDKAQLQYVKKLFNSSIKGVTFSEMNVQSGGMTVSTINPGYNIIIDYGTFSAAYLRSKTGIDKAIKENVSLFFIAYSVFEESNVLIKSAKKPYVIFDDGNPNVSRVSFSQENTIFADTPARIVPFSDTSAALEYFSTLCDADEVVSLFSAKSKDFSDKLCEAFQKDVPVYQKCNLSSFIKYLINISNDRKISSSLEAVIRKFPQSIINDKPGSLRCDIVVADSAAFITWHPLPETKRPFIPDDVFCELPSRVHPSPDYQKTYTRIVEDRDRLLKLVSLYTNGKESEINGRIESLGNSIQTRRELFSKGIVTTEEVDSLHQQQQIEEEAALSSDKKKKLSISRLFFNKSAYLREKGKLLEKKASAFYKKLTQGKSKTKGSTAPFTEFGTEKKRMPLPDNLKRLNSIETFWCGVKALNFKTFSLLAVLLILLIASGIYFRNGGFSDNNTALIEPEHIEQPQTTVVSNQEVPKNEKILTEEISQEYSQDYIARFDITVTPFDTLKYLNMIAVNNGYAPLSTNVIDSQKKNPHWIFPGNIFNLPEGGRVEVKYGDSLWKIAELLLTQRSIKYFETIEKISSASTPEEKLSLLKDAELYVCTEKIAAHFKRISKENERDTEN